MTGDRFEPGTLVTPELLVERRIVRSLHDGLKVLGDGELPHPLTIRAHKFSKSALEKLDDFIKQNFKTEEVYGAERY